MDGAPILTLIELAERTDARLADRRARRPKRSEVATKSAKTRQPKLHLDPLWREVVPF